MNTSQVTPETAIGLEENLSPASPLAATGLPRRVSQDPHAYLAQCPQPTGKLRRAQRMAGGLGTV
jgi:hypothetical protein